MEGFNGMCGLMHGLRRSLAILVMFACCSAFAGEGTPESRDAQSGRWIEHVLQDESGNHRYTVFLPPRYSPDKKWPVILFLHGAGERGRDGKSQLQVGLGPVLRRNPQAFPAIVVFPQAESFEERILKEWSPDRPDGARALEILAQVEQQYSVDPSHRILTGWSMGGYGAWNIAAGSEPGFWSTVLPLSGGCDPDAAARLPAGTPIWAIHGTTDRIVPESEMVNAVEAAKANPHIHVTAIEGVGHDVWSVAYGTEAVRRWMFGPESVDPETVTWSQEEVRRLQKENAIDELPFVPGTTISRAIAVRIGNEAFRAFGQGAPDAVSSDRLQGTLDDIVQTMNYGGDEIRASITDVAWTTELDSVEVQAVAAERLRICVGLRDLVLRSAGASIQGGPYRATTGPFQVEIGLWRPVMVEVIARPCVVDGAIRLNEQSIEFEIPDDNWVVREPAEATASGPGLTPDLVKIGVAGGLYRSKDRVENSVRQLIGTVLRRIEDRLEIVPPESLASVLWPLPTHPPRIRLQPQAIRTDRGGISLTIAVVAAAAPDQERAARKTEIMSAPIDESGANGVCVGIAPGTVTTLAEAFTNSHEARLNVLDAPQPGFKQLADPAFLIQAAPDLQRYVEDHELRTELIVEKAFTLTLNEPTSSESEAADTLSMHVTASELLLRTSRRLRGETGAWIPCVDFRLSLEDDLSITLGERTDTGRDIHVAWGREPQVAGKARFADGYEPVDHMLNSSQVVESFRQTWTDWTATLTSTSEVADLAVGRAELRLDQIPTRGERAWLQFTPVLENDATAGR